MVQRQPHRKHSRATFQRVEGMQPSELRQNLRRRKGIREKSNRLHELVRRASHTRQFLHGVIKPVLLKGVRRAEAGQNATRG